MITRSNCQLAAQVYLLEELSVTQIRALDRDKTVVFIPGGILEEHGPYLPCFTDGYMNESLTCDLANAVVGRPSWNALIFPTIPLGTDGANSIGEKHVFPGTYTVRTTTLRAVFMDLATELGEQGFRWIIVMHLHGAPNQKRVLNDVCAYFDDTYQGRMVNLAGLIPPNLLDPDYMDTENRQAAGFDVHAGIWETSWILCVQPDLVQRGYREAVPLKGQDMADLVRIAHAPDWPGYFSSPANSKALYGKILKGRVAAFFTTLIFRVLDGQDVEVPPDYLVNPTTNAIDRAALAEEARRAEKQNAWLRKRGLIQVPP